MPTIEYIYTDPTISTSAKGDTPYSIYDNDAAFVSESVDVAKYVAKKLGHPIMQLEFNSSSIYACFEEAVTEYGAQVNTYNIRDNMLNLYGSETGSSTNLAQKKVSQATRDYIEKLKKQKLSLINKKPSPLLQKFERKSLEKKRFLVGVY